MRTGLRIICLAAGVLLSGVPAVSAADDTARLYASYCAECHGASLEGARAPSLLNPRWKEAGASKQLFTLIHDGVPARGMAPWSETLTKPQIDQLVSYIQVRAGEAAPGVSASTSAQAPAMQTVKTDRYDIRIEPVLEHGLEQPRSLAIVNTDLLISDRKGLRTYSNGVLSEPVRGLPALDGLEEIAPHRAGNADWLYITYVCSAACGHEGRHRYTLARGRIRAGEWTDHQVLHEYGDGDHVYGVSKLAFDDKGFIYVTLSAAEHPGQDTEDFEAELGKAQDLDSHRGKILRLHDDGRVPRDNPFAGKPGALSTIWSYGHRGLSGIGYDVATQSLWATEHGPWGGDELNRIVRGGNYGWPLVSFGYHYAGKPVGAAQAPGMESPVFHWTPSVGVSAVQVYDGAAFANWRGSVLVGSLGARIGRTLYRFQLEDNRARLYQYPTDARNRVLRDEKGAAKPRVPRYEEIAPDVGRIRDVRIGAEGYIYLLLESPDRIVRLVPLPRSPGAPRQQ